MDKKSSAVLLSPFHSYNTSCIQFYYQMQGSTRDALSTLTLSVTLPDGSRHVIWEVRGISDNSFHFAQASVIPELVLLGMGRRVDRSSLNNGVMKFRLAFQLSGSGVGAALDDIHVADGDCDIYRSE